ncbi:MAG TPA: hydantoin utilization protein A, partial [Sulfitobacter pontiacus]|nr:hydantoin utilization protein A [Sulfitobacter pontiacus]
TIRQAVDLEAVQAAAQELLDQGCLACAILFANSYANAENERLAVEAVRAMWPNAHVSASSEILPEIREFERFSTTALNAYLQPEVSGYLARLETALKQDGFAGEFMIVQSNGGVMDAATAARLPVRTALSGPAAGVIAAGYIAEAAGFPDIITGDMGGTSFDVSLIAKGQSMLSQQTSIDFGMVVRSPMIEITTIGAGGGSIAWVDKGGLLNIGPESAGSTPGPVAYGQGNTRPTVTDANVVLGRIDPDNPIGGKLERLDVEAAKAAILEHVGTPLGLDALQAAEAILRVANSRMAGALRLVSIERGFDPKRFAFMPFGGGGALHSGAMMAEVGLARSIVPRYPGVTSAMGCVIADMRQDFVQTIN